MTYPSHQLWNLKPFAWSEYQVRDVRAYLNAKTGEIGLISARPWKYNTRMTNIPITFKTRAGQSFDAIARVNSPEGVTVTQDIVGSSLVEMMFDGWIGEVANQGAVMQLPPEPQLAPMLPVGYMMETKSAVIGVNGDTLYFPTHYFNVHIDKPWGQTQHTTRTALIEHPDEPANLWAENIVFDGEILDQWFGNVGAGGIIEQGEQQVRIRTGQNP